MATKLSTMEALATPYFIRIIEDDVKRIDTEIDTVWNQVKGTLSFKGFRKGCVPRSVAEHRLGISKLYQRLIDQIFNEALKQAPHEIVGVREHKILQFKKGMPVVMEAIVDVKPQVQLGQYKDIEIEEIETSVSDIEVDDILKSLQENNAVLTPSTDAAKVGDLLTVDFTGHLKSGKEFPGNSGENVEVVLGSHTFLEEFENQLVGTQTGETKSITITFPKDYGSEEVAGRKAIFSVKVKKVQHRELPELDDDFAKDNGYDDLDDARTALRADALQEKESQVRITYENALIDKVIENAQTKELPESMINFQLENILQQRAEGFKDAEAYLKHVKLTRNQFDMIFKNQAVQNLQIRLALEEVARQEDIQVSEQDIQEYIEDEAQRLGIDAVTLKNRLSVAIITDNIKVQKAVQLLFDNKKIVPKVEKRSTVKPLYKPTARKVKKQTTKSSEIKE